jgi:hypothetical protein
MFHPVAFALDELALLYGPPSRPSNADSDIEPDVLSIEEWRAIAEHAQFVIDHHAKFQNRIHRYEAGLNLLSATGLSTALALETELENAIADSVSPLISVPTAVYDTVYVSTSPIPMNPTWSSRFALSQFNRHVQDYMATLERLTS